MSIALMLVAGLLLFALGYRTYGRMLARRLALDPTAITPAHARRDDVDYMPTPRFYLLSQHFSAISAAGPIAGPILACLMFGWLPSLLWIVIGCVVIGAMHDFATLVASLRHRGCSIAEVVREHVNRRVYVVFTAFVWLALVYVITAFTDITARAFVGSVAATVPGSDTRVVIEGAGVASSSMLYLLLGVLLGVVTRWLRPPLWLATLVFVPLVGVAIWAGPLLPLDLAAGGPIASLHWARILLVYCAIASVLPLWLLLQPRGYLGGFFLYVVLIGGVLGAIVGNPTVESDAFVGFWSAGGQPLVPFLFVTIACGACSGFHGLVCSGTTSKQVDREPDAQLVGYGGMLLEGVVALLALACAMVLSPALRGSGAGPDVVFGLGIGGFLAELGIPYGFAVSFALLAFATFIYDTLDVCTRLARHLFLEFTGQRGPVAAVVGTVATLALPFWAIGETATDATGRAIPAYLVVWPLFGSSNQMLAGLTLAGLTLWLNRTGRSRLLQCLVGIPAVLMLGVTVSALWLQVTSGSAAGVLIAVGTVLLVLAAWTAVEIGLALLRGIPAARAPS